LLIALTNSQLPQVETELGNLVQLLNQKGLSEPAIEFPALQDALNISRVKIKAQLSRISSDAAEKKADRDFSAAETVLHAFLYELNIYSIAPVVVFDVARVWPINVPTRYALGGGVRFSLVNANFTIGYAANPVRAATEGKGALFVKLDVEDLFH